MRIILAMLALALGLGACEDDGSLPPLFDAAVDDGGRDDGGRDDDDRDDDDRDDDDRDD